MPGVSVSVKGVRTAALTDVEGHYTITVPNSDAVLVYSFLGFTPQEIKVGVRAAIDVTLKEDIQQIEEVVVIGYGTQTKKSLTAAVSVMDMKSIEANTHSTVSHALQGTAAGLRVVQTSAQPGGASSFRIRGETSINAGNDPLFVIDGMPIAPNASPESANQYYQDGATDNFLESLNPDDIESISVLKDAASTAIYGARAGHGVILITTKRGSKSQKPRLSYSGNYSFQVLDNNYLMLNPQQYMQAVNIQEYEQYLVDYGLDIYSDYLPSKPVVPFQPRYSAYDIANNTGTDWYKEVTRTGSLHQHNLSLSGGTEATRYMASLNYMNQEGIIKSSGASRFAARLNLDQDVTEYLTVGISANYAQNTYDNIPMGAGQNEMSGVLVAAYQANPMIPIYNPDGSFYIDPRRNMVDNPVALLSADDVTTKERLIASGYVTLKPVKGLILKALFGGDKQMNRRSHYTPKTLLQGAAYNGMGYKNSSSDVDYLMELTATYDKTIGSHKFNVLGGYSYQMFTGESVYASNRDFLLDSFSYNSLGSGAWPRPDVGSGYSKSSIYSWFGRIHYSFNDRYLIEGSIRSDGSSNFAKENSVGVFPAISGGWVISEEPFMESTKDWLSSVKVRASYGQTGNESVGRHVADFFQTGAWKAARLGTGETLRGAVWASELGNANLTWETTSEMNIGIDAGFLDNRIRLSAEYFDRRVSNLLTTRLLPSHNEVQRIYGNFGETGSRGFEITINSVNLTARNFEWTSTLTLSHHEDRWIKHFPAWVAQPYEGPNDPIRAVYEYRSLGILQPGQQPPKSQPNLLPGGVVVADLNGDNIINDYDKVYKGSADPALIYGLNNAVRYQLNKYTFDFNIYLYGETGIPKYGSYLHGDVFVTGGNNATLGAFETFRHDNLDSTHPNIMGRSTAWGDHYLRNIFYIRCGSITLGCTFPVTKIVEKIRVYFDVTNPFLITNYDGLDPETEGPATAGQGTGPGSSYPNVKSFNLGVNITF
jgi:TonB-linked SusC/RagA family outer membrane protein